MTLLRYIGLGAAGLVGLHGGAYAQEDQRLQISFTTRALHDSNLARSSEELARARGLVPEDIRISPSLDLDASLPIGLSRIFADARIGRDFHDRNKRLNRERLQARAGVETRPGACVFSAILNGARQQTELEDITFEPVENVETVFDGSLGINCPREGGMSPTLSVSHSRTDNSQAQRRNANNRVDTIEGGLNYVGSSIAEMDITLKYSRVDFPGRPLKGSSDPTERDGFQLFQVGVRMTRSVGSLVRGSARLAYTRVDVKGQEKAFNGSTFGADLIFLPHGRVQPRIVVERSLEAVNRIDVLYRVQTFARAEALVTLSPRMRFTGGGTWREVDYRLAIDFPGQVANERTWLAFTTLDVDVSPKFTATFFAQRENRDTNLPIFGFDSKRVGVATKISF